ncbi:MAG: hypothetical protein ACKVOR_07475 [Flavobacteriales bacterium]
MQTSSSNRLVGIDFAYALAILGIVVFVFSFTIGDKVQSALNHTRYFAILDVFPALFFFLNGLTVTLTMRDRKVSNRKLLVYMGKRGSVLMLIGLACCIIWPMNIFIATGLFYVATPFIAQWNNILLRIILLIVVLLGMLLLYMDVPTSTIYDMPNVRDGEIIGISGFILFNGYFSILPWFAFFCAGLLHGRTDIRPKGWLPPSSIIGLLLILSTFFFQHYARKIDNEGVLQARSDIFLLNIRLLYPAFCVFALGFSIIVTNAFIYFFRKFSITKILKFVQTVSAYKYSVIFFHMLIGIITLIASNRQFFHKKLVLVIYVVAATFATFYLTMLWRKRVSEKGPMEWLIKRISGSTKN